MHNRSYCKLQLEEDSVSRHKGERKVKTQDDDLESIADSIATESDMTMDTENVLDESDDDDGVDSGEENDEPCLESKMEKVEIRVKSEGDVSDSPRSESESHDLDLPQSESYDEGTSVKVEQCDDSKEESKNNSDNSDGEQMFPDTNITLQHVKGDK